MRKLVLLGFLALAWGLKPAVVLAQSCNTADRSLLLILDASGNMNAKLPDGETRIAVARRAIKGVAGFVPAQAQLALRMYGALSPAARKGSQNSKLALPFGVAIANAGAIASTVESTQTQGYTPIAYSLGQAANDFPSGATQRVIGARQRRQGNVPGRSRPGRQSGLLTTPCPIVGQSIWVQQISDRLRQVPRS